jgi:hypothetical protein
MGNHLAVGARGDCARTSLQRDVGAFLHARLRRRASASANEAAGRVRGRARRRRSQFGASGQRPSRSAARVRINGCAARGDVQATSSDLPLELPGLR